MLFLFREFAAADTRPATRMARVRAVLDWSLSFAFAALLVAAVWKLHEAPAGIEPPQAQPEGWVLWTGELPVRTNPPVAPASSEPATR